MQQLFFFSAANADTNRNKNNKSLQRSGAVQNTGFWTEHAAACAGSHRR